MRKFGSLGQYHDFLVWVLLYAPDRFRRFGAEPSNQSKQLEIAFDDLRSNFHLTKKNIKDERVFRVAQELLEMSYEAYVAGDIKIGAHTLQEFEGLVWKSTAKRPRYAVEAERRAFGENITYADVEISRYPYEGVQSDLGKHQATLLKIAKKYYEVYLSEWRDFNFFAWVIDHDGALKRISVDPIEDDTPVLGRGVKSLSSCRRKLKSLSDSGQIRACVLMEIIAPQGDGLVWFDLEQIGSPRVSARQKFKLQKGPSHQFEDMRYHLVEPQFLDVNDQIA